MTNEIHNSMDVFQSPQFQALLEYLGVEKKLTRDITIVLRMDEPCLIIESYLATKTTGVVDTTTLQNQEYRTKQPAEVMPDATIGVDGS